MPEIKLSPEELETQVATLDLCERIYALYWLASYGSDHPDGQALVSALAAVSRRRER